MLNTEKCNYIYLNSRVYRQIYELNTRLENCFPGVIFFSFCIMSDILFLKKHLKRPLHNGILKKKKNGFFLALMPKATQNNKRHESAKHLL